MEDVLGGHGLESSDPLPRGRADPPGLSRPPSAREERTSGDQTGLQSVLLPPVDGHERRGGGGWMSDIDVLPLEGSNLLSPKNYGSGTNAEVAWAGSGFGAASYLPNGGALTVHNGHVPCLVSGSGPEWDRMFRAVLNEALSHAHERPVETGTMTRGYYSDMISLQNLEEKDTAFFQTTNVVAHGHEIALDTDHPERSPVDCDVLKGMRAIHFSHRSMHHMYGDEDHTGERPRLARIWHDRWKKNCLSSSFV